MTILYMNFSENEKKKKQKDVRLLQDTHTRLRLEQHIASRSSRSRKWENGERSFRDHSRQRATHFLFVLTQRRGFPGAN